MTHQTNEVVELANTLNWGFYNTPASDKKLKEMRDAEQKRVRDLADIAATGDLRTEEEIKNDKIIELARTNNAFASIFMIGVPFPETEKTTAEKKAEKDKASSEAKASESKPAQEAKPAQTQKPKQNDKHADRRQHPQQQHQGPNRQERRANEHKAAAQEGNQFGPAPNGPRFTMGGQEVPRETAKVLLAAGSESTMEFRILYDKIVTILRTQKQMSIDARRGLEKEEEQQIVDNGVPNHIMSSETREVYAQTLDRLFKEADGEKLQELHDMIVQNYGKAMNLN